MEKNHEGETMNHFIKETANVSRFMIPIDSCGDFDIIYMCYPTEPDKNFYRFTGRNLTNGDYIEYSYPELDDVLEYVKKTYPGMSPSDWEELARLDHAYREAVKMTSYASNAKTRRNEDAAYKKLAAFIDCHLR